jgi:hypothetical protein
VRAAILPTLSSIFYLDALCVMWCLWRERNARSLYSIDLSKKKKKKRNAWSFEDCELGIIELKKRVLQTLFSWRVLWHSSQVSTLVEFLNFCASFSN